MPLNADIEGDKDAICGYHLGEEVTLSPMPTLIASFDSRFRLLHERSAAAVAKFPAQLLFKDASASATGSFGEHILRSAGAVEQAFGGITARLWDDPFEWTLPEELSSNAKILEYLEEVEATRRRGFDFFVSDSDLTKELAAPYRMKTIFEILLETLARAEHLQGRAFELFRVLTGNLPPKS